MVRDELFFDLFERRVYNVKFSVQYSYCDILLMFFKHNRFKNDAYRACFYNFDASCPSTFLC